MNFVKNNLHIFVSTLLVVSLLIIIINSVHAGYVQYKTVETKTMYGIMYVSSDGKKEYIYNSHYGSTSNDIEDIAKFNQKDSARKAIRKLLKGGWLDDDDGEVYVIEVISFIHNPEHVEKPKSKHGYCIMYHDCDCNDNYELKVKYYTGTQSQKYFRNCDFEFNRTASTQFASKKKAEETWQRILADLKNDEEQYNLKAKPGYKKEIISDQLEQIVRIMNYADIN